ncbi:MAG: Trm112 family protein [Nitrososphaeria archaeon]|nr:Trm112 family protein [Nitrososphaeria archaeon]
MRYRLMDILACPICKNFPLKLYMFEQTELKITEAPKNTCELFCAYKNIKPENMEKNSLLQECIKCLAYNIKWGIIVCEKCGRWYPISEEIPIMLPDEMRKVEDDINFLKMFEKNVPDDILKKGKPHHL